MFVWGRWNCGWVCREPFLSLAKPVILIRFFFLLVMEAFITDSTSFLVVTCSFSSNFFFLNPFSLLLTILTGEENHNHWGLVGRRKQSKPKLTKIRCRKPKIRKRDRFPPRTGFTFRDATLASLRPIWAISSEQEWGVGFRFVHTTVLCFASTQFRLFGTRGPGGGGGGAGLLLPTSGRLRRDFVFQNAGRQNNYIN